MTPTSRLLKFGVRCALLPTVILCLFEPFAASLRAQNTSGTSSRTNLYGKVCLTTKTGKKIGDCRPVPGIEVVAMAPGIDKQYGSTKGDGTFEIWVNERGTYDLTIGLAARRQGYVQDGSTSALVADVKARTGADPIYLTTSTPAPSPSPPHLVLVLYRPEEPSLTTSVALPQGDDQSELHGCVNDSDGAAVSQALVSVLVARKGSQRLLPIADSITDGKGCYTLPVKDIHAYQEYVLAVSRRGYNRFVILLDVNEAPPETIELEDESISDGPLLERDEPTRRQVFTSRLLETLPVGGLRNFDTFALLAPGVAPPPDSPNARGPGVSPGLGTAGQFSVNGLRSRENNFTADGSDNNDEDIGTRRQGFVFLAPQSLESLNEFQIVTALGDARFGRNIGGQVNVLTKSGSPDLHGSVYGFFTGNRLNAREFFDRVAAPGGTFTLTRQQDGAQVLLDGRQVVTPDPAGGKNPLTRTQLGFVVGGPIKLLDSFFFGSFERVAIRANKESHFIVPAVEQRGILNAGATGLMLDDLHGAPRPIYAASIPGDAIFSLYPFPNNPLGPFGPNTFTTVLPADGNGTRFSGKIDRQFGTSELKKTRRPWSLFNNGDNLTARYNFSQETSTVPVTGEALFSSLRPRVRTHNIAFYLNRKLGTLVSDVIRLSFGRTRLTFGEVRDPFQNPSSFFPNEPFLLNAPLILNVSAPLANETLTQPSFISASSVPGAALLTSLGYTAVTQAEQIAGALGEVKIPGFSTLGVDVYRFPQSRANNTIQIADTITYASPQSHIFTFGVDIKKIQINSTLDRNFRPQAVFGGLRTPLAGPPPAFEFNARLPGGPSITPHEYSGTTLAALGIPTGLFQTLAVDPNSTIGIRFTEIGLFEQSDFRLKNNLNLNVGARFTYLTRLRTQGKKLERALDLAELQRQGEDAIASCVNDGGIRLACETAAHAIVSAFPADFSAAFEGDKFDLDVRAGLAWSLNDRTIVRAGVGNYSGEFPGILLGESRNAFPDFLSLNVAHFPVSLRGGNILRQFLFNLANPALRALEPGLFTPGALNQLSTNVSALSLLTSRVAKANGLVFSDSVLGVDLVLPQKNFKTPYSLQYAVTVERRIHDRYALSVAYVGTRGLELLRVSTPNLGVNYVMNPRGLQLVMAGFLVPLPEFGGRQPLAPQAVVPLAGLAIARTFYESSGMSRYDSLQVEFRKQYARHFQFGTAFTYSHSIDDVSDFFDTAGAFALPQNSLVRSERASSNFDVRMRSVTHFVWDFPKDGFFSGGKRLGGWQLAGIVTAQTGQPYTVNSAFDTNRDGNLTDRLNSTTGLIRGSGSIQLSLAPGTNPLDLLAASGRDGAVGRNTFRAPGQFNSDISITKFFNFNERFRLNARTEIFNVLNNTNFGVPVRILESPAFGRSTYTTTPPRTVQFVVKFLF
ncbi:MAG TPA: carboxypeptidase-like regulatory domain-containing protein [Pyrinomonadaceae bacterium]|nr:carboxypeptidase-like regulatory domain-containing protein [Pyrinomonadaceae bacterium]